MIPSVKRKEWHELVMGSIEPKIASHSLRLKIYRLRKEIRSGKLSVDQAVELLHNECAHHYNMYKSDLHQIFSL